MKSDKFIGLLYVQGTIQYQNTILKSTPQSKTTVNYDDMVSVPPGAVNSK